MTSHGPSTECLPHGIVLLHGFGGLPLQTTLLARRLAKSGYTILNPLYPSWRWPLDRIANHLAPRIAAFAAQVDTLHCVGHSMGGLVVRAILTRHRPANLGRVVMLGTPNGGSEIADLLTRLHLHGPIMNRAAAALRTIRTPDMEKLLGPVDFPLGIIAGNRALNPLLADRIFAAPHDGKVSVSATHVPGQSDHLVLPVSHTAMIYSAPVAQQVVHFLHAGCFWRTAPPGA